MKPNANENPSAKSSLSKSMKKSTKSRSKNSKSTANNASQSQKAATPKVNPQEPTASTSASTATSEDSKESKGEKFNGNNRMSAFTAKSIKNFWEQYNTHEVDVMPEVFSRLAEDATYKVCELVQNIKIYARHSGGKVTYDLVNEVLKDSDVQPILGAGEMDFEKIEHEGTSYYFDNDNILELRDEYLKEYETKCAIKSEISGSWVLDKKHSKLLMDFTFCLNKAIFLGDNDAYKFGLDAAAFAPQIGCCLGLLFRKCIEMLAFDQKFGIVERCLKYLQALSINIFARDALVRQHLFHLSEIIVCLLLGTLKSIQPSIKKEPKLEKKEASFEIVKNYLENSDTDIKKEVVALNPVDVDDIRQEYEALFQMMERDGFQERPDNFEEVGNVEYIRPTVDICDGIKVEQDIELEPIQQHQQPISSDQTQSQMSVNQIQSQQHIKVEQSIGMDQTQPPIGIDQTPHNISIEQSQQQIALDQAQQQQINEDLLQNQPISIDQMSQETLNYQILDEPFTIVNEEHIVPEQTTDEMIAEAISLQFSPYQAKMVDFQNVDIVCDTLGNLGSQYGYFQTECIYLIQKRMEKFFAIKEVFNDNDYQYISRCFRGLIALGEAGIREILPFLEKINPDLINECYLNDFSLAAVFLRGPIDIFFYEWLVELCRDKLQPFMVFHYNFHEDLLKERLEKQRPAGYKIYSKIQLKSIEKLTRNKNEILDLHFPEKTIIKMHKRIGFKFSGCRPVLLKPKVQTQNFIQKPLQSFNSKIRIGKRKLFKPLTDRPNIGNCYNYCYTQI
ncbi:uncharacterized protein LOC129611855 [Condylostylus longicornis]|uniref:uncharacterized protein LOC129611855 n=1 Tax=Condylostylus longicornis TaxID=2530218 RepID=UPI00244DA57B|nr:uncharacterized protein LOC129611855 [Condylostylus longicornis]